MILKGAGLRRCMNGFSQLRHSPLSTPHGGIDFTHVPTVRGSIPMKIGGLLLYPPLLG